VTLPVDLRRRLGVEAGDDLLFEETPEGAVVKVVHRRALQDYLGALSVPRALDRAQERAAASRKLAERHR
jgi:bifunctional DNA-binding transcriptional regulator/antitoxin component of YhaV-PrlF toxin-antitoxin module